MPIPKCQYIIRKGESPLADRSNIFDWTPLLAEKTEKFEEFKEKLPTPTKTSIFKDPEITMAPQEDIKKLLVIEAIKKLEREDFTAAGLPKIFAIQRIVGFDIDSKLRDDAYAYYKSEMERLNG